MPDLPSGTVTFLFTDIEGSTRHWDDDSDTMRAALTRHDEIASSIVAGFGGALVKSRGEGDSLFAVFPLATDAVAAACALQTAFTHESWPDSLPLKVRMALHTGEATLRNEDYYGTAVNRCARIRAIGYGGQVLLSEVARGLSLDSLPQGCSLKALGEHRLKDLGRPEHVFQLCHPQLPAEFPPLRSLNTFANNLPVQLTSFVGRKKEIEELKALVEKTRLLTLTGSGGCGKTRMALQLAADVLDEYPDGVWLVELAALTDPALIAQTAATALGLKEELGRTLIQTLTDHLSGKHLLLLLDNCEHLLPACAQLTDVILKGSSGIRVLAASREGLGITGELIYRVPPLSMPDPQRDITPEGLSPYESVRLFIERAQFHQSDFAITNQNAPALAAVCHRLDGIPLAIELAAARTRSLSVDDINDRLDQRFRLLTGGSRTALPRQQTLRSLIDWSYDLLSDQEKIMLRRLSVFAGGWSLTSAETVCTGEGIEAWDVLDLLTRLSEKSLVAADTSRENARFRLLETIRQYAGEKLDESGEEAVVRAKHRDHFLKLAESADHYRFANTGPRLMAALEQEHDNCRAALDFCAAGVDADIHLRFTGSLSWLWLFRGHLQEGRERLAAALSRPGGTDRTVARALALKGAGNLARTQGDINGARSLFEESAGILRNQSQNGQLAFVIYNLGLLEHEEQRYDSARAYYDQSLSLMRDVGDEAGSALVLNAAAHNTYKQNDLAGARELFVECIALCRRTGNHNVLEVAVGNQALVAMAEGDYPGARVYLGESLALQAVSPTQPSLANMLLTLADLATCVGRPRLGIGYLSASAAMRDRHGMPLPPSEQAAQNQREQVLRSSTTEEEFARAWEEAQALTTEQALDLAREIL